jgi:hypothetical protein
MIKISKGHDLLQLKKNDDLKFYIELLIYRYKNSLLY